MKTKEELKSTFIRYQPEITKDVFKRIIDRIGQLGFTQYSTSNDYEDFVSNCLVLSSEYSWYIINESSMNKRTEIEVSDILGDGWKDVKWSVDSYVVFCKDGTHHQPIGKIDKIIEDVNSDRCIVLEGGDHCSIAREETGQIKWFATLSEAEAFSKSLLEPEETKTVKDKYVEYNENFTEDMFNYMLDWVKKQDYPYDPYGYCANTFDNFKTKGYFWFGSTRGYSYGVDNNPQYFDEITFEELFPEYSKPTIKKSKEFDRNWYVKVDSQEEANLVFDWLKNKGEEITTGSKFVENRWSKIWFCLNSIYVWHNTWCIGFNEDLPTNLKEKQLSDIIPEYKQSSGCIFLESELDDVTVELIDVPDI